MYKPPYIIQPSSLDFFSDRLHGSGKWTLQRVSRPFDHIRMDAAQQFSQYSFYHYVGTSVRTSNEVERDDALLVKPNDYHPAPYIRAKFQVQEPTQETVDEKLAEEAKQAVRPSLFYNVDKRRRMYVIERRGSRLDEEQKKWLAEKEAFEKAEDELELKHNAAEKKKRDRAKAMIRNYNKAHKANELFLYTSQQEVEDLFQQVDPHFPSNFEMYYQVDIAHKLVNISFEAPSKRIIPEEKTVIHSRGISLKEKTRTEINKDYLDCICGLSYVIAAQCFNLTAKVDNIFISATSKEFNQKTATLDEQTLYSIVFDRETFNWVISPKSFLPYESFVFFPHAIELGARLEIRPINPLDLVRAGEILQGPNSFIGDTTEDYRFMSLLADEDLHQRDKLFEDAARLVVQNQQVSTATLQRNLCIGYNKAGRLMDQLEAAGIIGPFCGTKLRTVLISDLDTLDKILERLQL